MHSSSVDGPLQLARGIKAKVWCAEPSAIARGEALCYVHDYGTAGDADASRGNRVAKPTHLNNKAFAGVAVDSHPALTSNQAGRLIEIYLPGSKSVPVALAVDTVIGVGLLSFVVAGRYNRGVSTGLKTDAGRFFTGKYRGRGSVIPRQTVTALIESDTTGVWSLAADGLTLTMASTAGLVAGDKVVLFGGLDDDTGAVIPGEYEIDSVDANGTDVVLKAPATGATAVDFATTALKCIGAAFNGNPTALCDLLDGEESCGVEFLSPPAAGMVGLPYMTRGVSYVVAGTTIAADVDITFAQGELPGDKKAVICLGTFTTGDLTVDLVTNGIQIDGSTALAEFNALDAAGDACYLEFRGARWFAMDLSGGATQA